MKISPTLDIEELLNNYSSPKTRKIILANIKFLEKYFGSKLLLENPPLLAEINTAILDVLKKTSKLRSLGNIRHIVRPSFSDEPFQFCYVTEINGKKIGRGTDFFQKESALWKSFAEAVERTIWFSYLEQFEKNTYFSSYKNITSPALDIFSLAGFSQEQREKNSRLAFDENTRLAWVPVKNILTEKKVFCPLQLIGAHYFEKRVCNQDENKNTEPILRWAITTGLATAPNKTEALVKGILEVIERDAFMIAYLNKLPLNPIDLDDLASQDEEIREIYYRYRRYNLDLRVFQLPTDFPVFVNLCLIIDPSGIGPTVTVGASASFSLRESIIKSISESQATRTFLRITLKKKSIGNFDLNLKTLDRDQRTILWSKRETLPEINFLLQGEKIKVKLTSDKLSWEEKLSRLKDTIRGGDYKGYYIDLTTPEVQKIGLTVIQTIIPELQPLHLLEKFPYFGGKRIKEIPKLFGYVPTDPINTFPHPFP